MIRLNYARRAFIRTICVGLPASLAMGQFAYAESKTEKARKGDGMSVSEISWVFSVSVKDGALEKLKTLIDKMADHSKSAEPGTLGYQWSISDDGKNAQVHEHYRDSAAALSHLSSFNANFAGPLMELVTPTGMVVFGDPDAALKEAIEGANPIYMQPAGGFVR
ncbi:MAG: antibiotic biosynthesis monooxygenase family protein [Pseudomonadota bacterium]